MKPHASYYTKQLKNLNDEVNTLQSRLQQLREEHLTLQVQQHVLASCCDVLHWLRGGAGHSLVHRRWLAGIPDAWPQAELELLQQLGVEAWGLDTPLELQMQQLHVQQTSSEGTKSSQHSQPDQHMADAAPSMPAAAGPGQAQPQQQQQQESAEASVQQPFSTLSHSAGAAAASSPTLSAAAGDPGGGAPDDPASQQAMYVTTPPGNYLSLLWQALSQPPDPRAPRMTLQQFAEYWGDLVKNLSLSLALVEQQGPQFSRQQPEAGACSGLQHPLLTLRQLLLRHLQLVSSVVLRNREGLVNKLRLVNLSTLELSDTPEQTWERVFWLAERLQLREDQQLTAGCSTFKRLLDKVLADRQQLLEQQAPQTGLRLPNGRCADLEAEQQAARQLQVLARKEQFLVACAGLFMGCVLDVVQLGRAIVLMWPFVPHFAMLGPAVMKHKAAAAQDKAAKKGQGRQH